MPNLPVPGAGAGPLRPDAPPGLELAEAARLINASSVGSVGLDGADRLYGATVRAQDTRPGDLFAALAGARAHGAQFAGQAVAGGASAILTDAAGAALIESATIPVLVCDDPRQQIGTVAAKIYGDPSQQLPIIGVTGTSGKTTTCFLIEAALAAQDLRTGLIGTVLTRLAGGGAEPQVIPSAFTTPEAPDLQALFAVMLEQGVQAAAMEVSSHALELGRVNGTRYAVGAFTNLSQDHLDFHPDMDSYFRAKAKLFDGRAGAAVINVDDPAGRRLADELDSPITLSATGAPADWRVLGAQVDPTGRQHLQIAGPGGMELVAAPGIPGEFNRANALTALACVAAAGYDVTRAAKALGEVAVPGRMQRVDAGQEFLAVVDYAHKPGAVAAVLDAVRGSVPGRLIVVLGAGGDRDQAKRPLMGAEAAARADVVIVTDDNPRSEEPQAIRASVLGGIPAGSAQVEEIGDRRAAIRAAIALARPGDAVVIAGKGHETGQEIGGIKHPFDDTVELCAALEGAR